MDVMTENGEAIGEYPPTVAIKQRKQVLEVEEGGGRSYNMSEKIIELSTSSMTPQMTFHIP